MQCKNQFLNVSALELVDNTRDHHLRSNSDLKSIYGRDSRMRKPEKFSIFCRLLGQMYPQLIQSFWARSP
jgi:hypothetical protein